MILGIKYNRKLKNKNCKKKYIPQIQQLQKKKSAKIQVIQGHWNYMAHSSFLFVFFFFLSEGMREG